MSVFETMADLLIYLFIHVLLEHKDAVLTLSLHCGVTLIIRTCGVRAGYPYIFC